MPKQRLGGRTVAGRPRPWCGTPISPQSNRQAYREAEYGKNDWLLMGSNISHRSHVPPVEPASRNFHQRRQDHRAGARSLCAWGRIRIGQADKAHHSDGEQGVEVIGDSGTKRGKIAGERPGCPEVASHRGGPAGNRRDDADGRGSGINDIGQLGARNFVESVTGS